jgi:hypothetical protein
MNRLIKVVVFLYLTIIALSSCAQVLERPFIWTKQKDKADLLNKIETQAWAKSFYTEFKNRLDNDLELYKKSPKKFLEKLPFDWSNQKQGETPPFKTFNNFSDGNFIERYTLNKYLQIGIDCGVLYFLTEEKIYAQCALDILHTFNESITQLQPSEKKGNGGWIYPNDHLREARVFGAQVPIIYDFIVPYLNVGNQPFDLGKNNFTKFSEKKAQTVFLTYAKLAVEHGHTGSNWSVLESFSLVQNAMALNNLEQREKYLNFYLKKGTDTQDALVDISKKYKKEGDVYPETSQYSNGVASFTTRLLLILDKYNPNLKLGKKHYKIPFSLDRWNSLVYPNNQIIRFGDGKRKLTVPYTAYEMAYHLGQQNNVPQLIEKFGPLISKSIAEGKYNRANVGKRPDGVTVYYTPLKLLWFNQTKDYAFEKSVLPRTDKFPHAGVFLQRNLSPTGIPDDGLMCFVGGSHMVHGHASGMDMELYGLGEVLGVDHGRGPYRTDLHENYSRLFAAHNTVVVNGASQGEGDWVNLGMNSTELIMMEPLPTEAALSPNYSFSRTSFIDDKGDKAEATQERTMALIRTSQSSGFYVDIFRSKSALPDEYHDYLYHNIGDKLTFKNKDLKLNPDKSRFQANANGAHIYNKKFRNPGWHFFEQVESSTNYESDVSATFKIKKLQDKNRFMNLFILGNKQREYTKVLAPKTFEAPLPYKNSPTPTLVIRQKGEAWTNPFAVIYEPNFGKKSKRGIKAVSKLEVDGIFKGFKIISKTKNNTITHYIVSQEKEAIYQNKELGFYFKGAFAIITHDVNKKTQNIYIGEGLAFTYDNISLHSKNAQPMSVYIDFTKEKTMINASENVKVIVENN